MRALIEAGADVNAQDSYPRPPLHYAARFSSGPVVRALVKAGADVDAQDEWQRSPLHWAASDNPTAVTVLLEGNAEVNLVDHKQGSPLSWAANNKQRDSVVALCNAGADPHLKLRFGYTTLTHPLIKSDMKALIKNHCN